MSGQHDNWTVAQNTAKGSMTRADVTRMIADAFDYIGRRFPGSASADLAKKLLREAAALDAQAPQDVPQDAPPDVRVDDRVVRVDDGAPVLFARGLGAPPDASKAESRRRHYESCVDYGCVCRDPKGSGAPAYRMTDDAIRAAVRGHTTRQGRPVRWVAWDDRANCCVYVMETEPQRLSDGTLSNPMEWSRLIYALNDPARAGTTLWCGPGADPRDEVIDAIDATTTREATREQYAESYDAECGNCGDLVRSTRRTADDVALCDECYAECAADAAELAREPAENPDLARCEHCEEQVADGAMRYTADDVGLCEECYAECAAEAAALAREPQGGDAPCRDQSVPSQHTCNEAPAGSAAGASAREPQADAPSTREQATCKGWVCPVCGEGANPCHVKGHPGVRCRECGMPCNIHDDQHTPTTPAKPTQWHECPTCGGVGEVQRVVAPPAEPEPVAKRALVLGLLPQGISFDSDLFVYRGGYFGDGPVRTFLDKMMDYCLLDKGKVVLYDRAALDAAYERGKRDANGGARCTPGCDGELCGCAQRKAPALDPLPAPEGPAGPAGPAVASDGCWHRADNRRITDRDAAYDWRNIARAERAAREGERAELAAERQQFRAYEHEVGELNEALEACRMEARNAVAKAERAEQFERELDDVAQSLLHARNELVIVKAERDKAWAECDRARTNESSLRKQLKDETARLIDRERERDEARTDAREELAEEHAAIVAGLAREQSLIVARDEARAERDDLRRHVASLDCRYTGGRHADTGGLHCPADRPCVRCQRDALILGAR